MTNEEFQRLVLEKLNGLETGQEKLESDVKDIKKSVMKIEHEHGDKISALFDAREIQTNVNEKIVSTLDRIEAKVEVLQLETSSLRRIK